MPKKQPIGRIIRELAERDPQRPAVTCGRQTISREQLERRSNRLARAYAQLGVMQGDFVTIALPNSVEFYLATVAVWKLGAIPQPVSWRLPLRERQAIVELAGSVLVAGAPDPSDHPGVTGIPAGFEPAAGLDDGPLPDRISPSWKAPTSGGSTGRAKLIVDGHSGDIDLDQARGMLMQPDECQLVCGPLYHNAPFTFSGLGLFMGHHLVVLPRFDTAAAIDAIRIHRVGWMMVVPTMMQRIWRAVQEEPERFDPSSLRVVLHAAAACPEWVKEAWIGLIGPERLWEMYSGTESQAIAALDGTEWLEHRGSVGRPRVGEMTVLDADGIPVPPRVVGEIFMRAPQGHPGYRYIGAEARAHGDWESLGDLGWMDEDGYLYLSDRRTDLIVSGGANVYPAEVEAALSEHPAVLSSVVVGLPDDDLGQRVHAVVQTTADVGAEDLLGHLAERLVRYKIPRSIEFTDQLLRDDAGKARRAAIRDAAVARMDTR
ncbi:AMP-binding protein [Streptomyces actinomycinicus]|uniref:AMP-binding protein n=1 Tax=Streptomyces actinomycinicus TaxID=1695166 RepID=A0A937EJE6_9ACTN|nr:AMP-binding protein [Streptomyces actinomycinicus]MBL1083477.1 AMP-binding protein [Streptomyces actinomycinicus]